MEDLPKDHKIARLPDLLRQLREIAMRKRFAVVIVATVTFMASCIQQVDLESEEAAATALVAQLWQAFESQDLDLLSQVMAHDPEMIIFGTDAAERFVGYEAFMAAEKQMVAAFDVEQLSVHDEVLTIHGSGEVAWFSVVADAEVTVGGEHVSVEGVRITGVLEKRDARWAIVQYHSSVPVAGQNIEY
jgi:ketosteroid isomerase-like protein